MSDFSLALRANRTPAVPKADSASWQSLDPSTLPEDLARLYFAYRQAFDAAEKARKLFEEETNEAYDVGATNKLAFGYRFGKLSVAIVPRSTPSAKSAVSLASIAKPR
jgi:hypothetical protein